MNIRSAVIQSPFGPLKLQAIGDAISAIGFADEPADAPDRRSADELLQAAAIQLDAYFAGRRRQFDLPLAPAGTAFQQRVWAALREIPFGDTDSYGALAGRIGAAGSARAVGAANRSNPIAIVVPCHRVIGSDGALTGYAGGLERKRRLLLLESSAGNAGDAQASMF